MPEALQIQDTSWSGPAATEALLRSVINVDTVDKGVCRIMSDVRKTFTLPRIEVSGLFQRRQATPNSQGTITVDGKSVTPQDVMLYLEFNPRDFESHFWAEYLPAKLLNRTLPQNAEQFIMKQVMKRAGEFWENSYWRSRIAYDLAGTALDPTTKGELAAAAQYYYFDGFIEKILADPNILQTPSPATFTASNIRTRFQSSYSLIPAAMLYKYGPLGLKIITGYQTQLVYEQALREDAYKNENTTEKGINRWSGYDIVPVAGMPANTYLMGIANPETAENNLFIAINSEEDNTLEMAQKQKNSELWFLKGLYKVDTQVGFADQIVIDTNITQ